MYARYWWRNRLSVSNDELVQRKERGGLEIVTTRTKKMLGLRCLASPFSPCATFFIFNVYLQRVSSTIPRWQMTQQVSAPRVVNKAPNSSHVGFSKPSGQELAGAVGETPTLRRSISQPVGRGHSRKVTLFTKETTLESTGSSTNEEDDGVRYVL